MVLVISIISAGDRRLFPQVDNDKLLTLEFDDIEARHNRDAKLYEEAGYILFKPNHAVMVMSYFEKIQQISGNNVLLVHCTAGVSRSGAIAVAACEAFNLNVDNFLRENIHINPNRWVLNLLGVDAERWDVLNVETRKRLRQKGML